MFYLDFNAESRVRVAAITTTCQTYLESLNDEAITFSDACMATQLHRHSLGLANSLPPIFVRLSAPLVVGSVHVEGYWLFHANKDGLTGFVTVPAYLKDGDFKAIVPPKGKNQNDSGLEITMRKPCPLPLPCPPNEALASDAGFLLRFP